MTNSKDKVLGRMEAAGLAVVLVCAVAWTFPPARGYAGIGMAAAAALTVLGRFLQRPFYEKRATTDPAGLVLRRLYRQRVFGAVALVLSAGFMLMPPGFYAGLYVGGGSWLIPFVFFTVVEVYTAFRISAVENS